EDDKYYQEDANPWTRDNAPPGGKPLDWYSWANDGPKVLYVDELPTTCLLEGDLGSAQAVFGPPGKLYNFNCHKWMERGLYSDFGGSINKCGTDTLRVSFDTNNRQGRCDVGTILAYTVKDNDDNSKALEDLKRRKPLACIPDADVNRCCAEGDTDYPEYGTKWQIGRSEPRSDCVPTDFVLQCGVKFTREDLDNDGHVEDDEITKAEPCIQEGLSFKTRCNECADCVPDFECYEELPPGNCERLTGKYEYNVPVGECPEEKGPKENC
ncbi:hypothetical protein COY95_05190, partial [Candidatus Woesearchaeota archaeon CG_4_10_14_0_8_um_filter_47_5]